ncbi:MFS transporter [Actinoplanes sp. LDG1-06]|uniref:MFS transporter n=1 Tax=Paractinoplanes ovalisporus TaxID=2810368 RepID=A0ABS2A5R2_9ACTN|nr:MFS transporter [Actinoplanes ovalisporus]
MTREWRGDFRRRWAAYAVSEFGSAVGYSALPLVAVLVLGASDFRVSLLTVLAGVVSAVAALPLGPWIEHHRKLPVMVTADLVRFLAVLSVPTAAWLGILTYWHLAAVAMAQMAARLAFDAAGIAQLRTLVPREHRADANGRFETTLWTTNAVGPAAGGLLISALGATVTMVVDALSFLLSALLLHGLRHPEPPPPPRAPDHHWRRDITAGWRHILGHPGLAALFWNSLIFGGCIMALSPLLAVLVVRDLGFPPWQYGLIIGTAGVAGVAGSLLAGPLRRRLGEHRLMLASGVGRNLWLVLIPLAPANATGLVLIAAAEFLLVLFAGMFSPTFATYRMNATDDGHMSRVVMAWSVTNKVVQPVFIAAAGAVAAATNARTALTIVAVVLLGGVAFLPWRVPES